MFFGHKYWNVSRRFFTVTAEKMRFGGVLYRTIAARMRVVDSAPGNTVGYRAGGLFSWSSVRANVELYRLVDVANGERLSNTRARSESALTLLATNPACSSFVQSNEDCLREDMSARFLFDVLT